MLRYEILGLEISNLDCQRYRIHMLIGRLQGSHEEHRKIPKLYVFQRLDYRKDLKRVPISLFPPSCQICEQKELKK